MSGNDLNGCRRSAALSRENSAKVSVAVAGKAQRSSVRAERPYVSVPDPPRVSGEMFTDTATVLLCRLRVGALFFVFRVTEDTLSSSCRE